MPNLAPIALAALIALPVVSPLACTVPETNTLSTADSQRMSGFETARVRGLAEAMLGEDNERASVAALFSPGTQAIKTIPDGNYQCRTLKLGGNLPLTVYGYFNCKISDGGSRIDKTSGSQRFNGTLSPAGGALFYQGAIHYNDDPVRRYGEDAEFDQVGCLYRVREQAIYRLELPYPIHESLFDVIELRPTR